jgi:hypothetical protein
LTAYSSGESANHLFLAELPLEVSSALCRRWTEDNLLRQVVYDGLREDKPASEVRREMPHANSRDTK